MTRETREVPSLKTEEGRFEFLRGELRVIKESVGATKQHLEQLNQRKVDKSDCKLQGATVTSGLRDVHQKIDTMAAGLSELLNGKLEDRIRGIVDARLREHTERLELEQLRKRTNRPPLVTRMRDHLALILAVLTLVGSLVAGGSWAFSWLAGKVAEQARTAESIDVRLSKLRAEPRYVPAPPTLIITAPDAGPPPRSRPRRRTR